MNATAKANTVSPSQLQILQHSLGVDQHGRGQQYRNHFCTGEGSSDYADCRALVDLGLMRVRPGMNGDDYLFHVTAQGVTEMHASSPPPAKLSRSKRRYQIWLEADSGELFGDWLKRSQP